MEKRTLEEMRAIALKELGTFGVIRHGRGWKAVSGTKEFHASTQEEAAEKLLASIGK